jgi:glycine hydroxymethyltransferase
MKGVKGGIQRQIVANARLLAQRLQAASWRIVAGGTDTHLLLVDVGSQCLPGQEAEEALKAVGIHVNRNLIPFDEREPLVASGIRTGTQSVAFRGLGKAEINEMADIIVAVLLRPRGVTQREALRSQVRALCARFPIYGHEQQELRA